MKGQKQLSMSEIASIYHHSILRIPHGNQHPKKRYLNDEEILNLFDGTVVIQEKVDGKMRWEGSSNSLTIVEDMTGKHTVHNHVMKYKGLPENKQIYLDYITVKYESIDPDKNIFRVFPIVPRVLDYAILILKSPTKDQIYNILGILAKSPSHFGSPVIEGLVIKNYDSQLFGKWINDDFEDKL